MKVGISTSYYFAKVNEEIVGAIIYYFDPFAIENQKEDECAFKIIHISAIKERGVEIL